MKLRLFLTFFRIGGVGFDGLGSVLGAADITEALIYTKLLPGSTVVQLVSYLGWRLGGWGGSAQPDRIEDDGYFPLLKGTSRKERLVGPHSQ
jgi:hypothetical protein